MASKFVALSFLASLASALPQKGAAPAPVEKRADCTVTTLGYVTPTCGGTEVVPVTRQGQPCTTYSPTAYVCNGYDCATQYSTSTYNWYSTYVPCAQGVCFCDRGDTYITLPPQPQATSYKVESIYCPTTGVYTAGGQEYYVTDCPSYIYYAVPYSSSYHQCTAEDYFQWLWGAGGAGVSLDVDYITCIDGVCTQAFQTWTYSIGTELQWVEASFSGFCTQSGPCELSAYIAGYGSVSITININISSPTAITTVTSAQVTVTTTATQTVTATTTTTATSVSATATAGGFVLAINVAPAARMAKRQTTSKPLGYAYAVDGTLHLTTVASEALAFGISAGGTLYSGLDVAFATPDDVALGSFDVEFGSPAAGDYTQTFSLGAGNALTWVNPAFTPDTASFCLLDDRIIGVYDGVNPAGCLAILLAPAPAATPISSSSTTAGQTGTSSVPGVTSSTSARGIGSTSAPVSSVSSATVGPSSSLASSTGQPQASSSSVVSTVVPVSTISSTIGSSVVPVSTSSSTIVTSVPQSSASVPQSSSSAGQSSSVSQSASSTIAQSSSSVTQSAGSSTITSNTSMSVSQSSSSSSSMTTTSA